MKPGQRTTNLQILTLLKNSLVAFDAKYKLKRKKLKKTLFLPGPKYGALR
jgi:hypothetical protein